MATPRPIPATAHHAPVFIPVAQGDPAPAQRKRQTHKSSAEGKRRTLAYRAARQAKRYAGEV